MASVTVSLPTTFIERAENVVFLGPPGTGKMHLSV
ncbi:MAG TPA: hypothetical protein DCZ10_16950, partial [Pelotomaculum sp.]|nr:hypothetical protein [Pelotomaculum sp.]